MPINTLMFLVTMWASLPMLTIGVFSIPITAFYAISKIGGYARYYTILYTIFQLILGTIALHVSPRCPQYLIKYIVSIMIIIWTIGLYIL